MASRLSDLTIKSGYDAGHKSLPWDAPRNKENLLDLDLDALADAPNAGEVIPTLPAQLLYHAMKRRDLAASSGVLKHVSIQQITRLFDYDCWQEDQLDPRRAFAWLSVLGEISPDVLCNRFSELEEEYQIALLQKFIKVYSEEEKDRLPLNEQDDLIPLPGQKFFYDIDSSDKATVKFIVSFIDAFLQVDPDYTSRLLAAAAYAVPGETEDLCSQFRIARLEEDGFVTYEESLAAFEPVDLADFTPQHDDAGQTYALRDQRYNHMPYIDQVVHASMERGVWTSEDSLSMQQGFLLLGNTLCAAAKIESDDLDGLNRVLEQLKALVCLGLEHASKGDLSEALAVLRAEHPKTLFRLGLTLTYGVQERCLSALEAKELPGVEDLRRLWGRRKWGALQRQLDVRHLDDLGFELAESLKGLFNRFPMFLKNMGDDGKKRKFAPIACLAELQLAERTVLRAIDQDLRSFH